ncbi:hypothetical protein [Kaistella polysaccharea]|uniref:hypothetical protein n=1 Tax=Kaistella polysaccharea TaxID=2878534 RepID=UPI001CF4C6BE|nr:hypothetical protein [Kaistella polysaccharea]
MKKYLLLALSTAFIISCTKVEEKISQEITKTSDHINETAQNAVKETLHETLNNSISSLANAENAEFKEVFPTGDPTMISEFKGKKFTFPNGSPAFLFKYKAEKETLLPFLESQETSDIGKSDETARKIDGQSFIDKLSFVEKFLPENTIDMSFLQDIKNDKSIEYYKLKRYPNKSTLIYNPKTQQVYQFVEVSK